MKAVRLMKTGFIRDGTSNSRSDRHHFIIIQRKKNVRNPPGRCCFNGASMIGMERFFFWLFFNPAGLGRGVGGWWMEVKGRKKEKGEIFFLKNIERSGVSSTFIADWTRASPRCAAQSLRMKSWGCRFNQTIHALSLSLSLSRSSPNYLSLSYLRLLMRRSIRQ